MVLFVSFLNFLNGIVLADNCQAASVSGICCNVPDRLLLRLLYAIEK